MRRLYYIADDLPTTRAISETLHDEGISDWNFHVVAKDEDGLYRHHISIPLRPSSSSTSCTPANASP